MKQRIWELDAFRGICLIGMVIIHFLYDLTVLYGIVTWEPPAGFVFVQQWGGVLFLLLSGICVTLGSRSVRRGLIVLASGMIVSAVTYGMYRFGFSGRGIIIYFGILHCLGICMLLWFMFKKLPWWALAVLGCILVGVGMYFRELTVESLWLFPLGLTTADFQSSDYFPILPYLGFFLLGAALGRTVYGKKQTLLPKVNDRNFLLRALQWCGRQSLLIYLLHQPVLNGICALISLSK